jgi:hypothetical protein
MRLLSASCRQYSAPRKRFHEERKRRSGTPPSAVFRKRQGKENRDGTWTCGYFSVSAAVQHRNVVIVSPGRHVQRDDSAAIIKKIEQLGGT